MTKTLSERGISKRGYFVSSGPTTPEPADNEEQTFEEELKKQCYCHGHYQCHWCYILTYSEEIKKYFLSKSRVKEAIEKAEKEVTAGNGYDARDSDGWSERVAFVLKELKLEEKNE